jgi:outer membrane receptor protein involved in Fe transport
LKSEYGWNYEAGSDYEFITSSGAVKNEITFYYHHTYDLILWQPNGEDGKWTPINVNESKSKGVEYMGESKFVIPNGLIQIRYMYSFTHAKIYDVGTNSVSQQRPFVPKHNANMSAAITFRSYNLQYIHSFFGRSYYDDLHTIDQFHLH